MLKEFKEFAVKGNMIDLAVGVIIGGAFSGIVTSLVNDVIMPVLSIFTGKIDFTNLFITLDGKKYETLEAAQTAGSSTVNIGLFVTQLINFLILAFVVFILVKQINRLKKPVVAPVATKDCPYCKSKIHIEATRCPSCTAELTK